jgi:hypothetical protein
MELVKFIIIKWLKRIQPGVIRASSGYTYYSLDVSVAYHNSQVIRL